jgi:hypothetical protein
MNWTELQTAIQDWTQNSESTFVSHLDDFVIATENIIYDAVKMTPFWTNTDQTLVADTAEYLVGGGCTDIMSVRIGEAAGAQTPVEDGPVRYLIQKDFDFLLEAYPGTTVPEEGIPKYYAIKDRVLTSSESDIRIRLGPIPTDAYGMSVTHYAKLTTDSVTSATNTWISVVYPEVLLYGALVHAYTFMKGEPDLVQQYEKMFLENLQGMKTVMETRQGSDDYRVALPPTPPSPPVGA